MSLQRPTSYAPRITALSLMLIGLLGVGFNVDALLGPIPEPGEGAEEAGAKSEISNGTDFDMESEVAKVMLEKATEALLKEASSDLPALPEDWSPAALPRDQPNDAYVEDDDEAEYYDELDQLKTVLKASNTKEREALNRLFDKEKPTAGGAKGATTKRPSTPARATKTLAMRPNAAVITRKKPKAAGTTAAAKAKPAARKATRPAAAKPTDAKLVAQTGTPEPQAEEPAAEGPVIDPTASAKALITQGRKLLLSGNPTTAEKAYRLALKKSPGSARARYGLAKALYQRNRGSEATAELRKILNANRNHGPSLLMMGSLLQEQGQAGEAKTYYQRYLDARPNGRRADEVRSILGRL
ncbi:MAG: tetratricopeptide repeat protein [Myxococcota bacterium]